MSIMFWVWLSVIVVTAILEIVTADLVSIWFTFGAILPFIFASTNIMTPIWQIVIFVLISAVLIACLRKITLKFLFKNANTKTNVNALIGQKFKMLERTDFETVGKVKVNDLEWSAVAEKQQTIEKGKIVEVVGIEGNRLILKEVVDKKNADNEVVEKEVESDSAKKKTKK